MVLESFPIKNSNWVVEIQLYMFGQRRIMVTDNCDPTTPLQF